MASKGAYTVREDKQGLQKQLGCMNGIFQLFDRRYLLGLHRCKSQNRLTPGQGENGEKEFKNSSENAKEANTKKMMIEKNRTSVESSRNSFSSSCSSTTFSSFDCSKRIQTEMKIPSNLTSPNSQKKQPDWCQQPPDIRDVVKDSMTREIRVTKDARVGPVINYIDSPRPFIQQKSVQYDRKDHNLTKIKKDSSKEVKGVSRFSCDERESQYSLKSSFKVKELPRLSLDSKQNSNRNSMNESRSESGSNKTPSSGVVARLMGLESLTTDSICKVENMKIKSAFSDKLVSGSRWSRDGDECKHNHVSVSPRVYLMQEGVNPVYQIPSVYGEMEKRLSAIEFKPSGKDLRALKQILEAMQMNKTENKRQSLDIQKTEQIYSPTVKGPISPKRREILNRGVKPAKMKTESMMVTSLHNVNHKARKQVKDQTPKNNISKATSRTPRSLSPSSPREYLTREKPVSSPRMQMSKNGIDKQCFKGPSTDSSRVKKQSDLKIRLPKIKPTNPTQNNKQSCRYSNETRNPSQDCDTVSFKSECKQEATRASENNFDEILIEDKPTVDLAKLTTEQASPVSVLDAFYVEDIPSPVKKKQNAFNDYDNNLHVDETEWNQAEIYDLVNRTDADEFHQTELLNSTEMEAIVSEVAKSPCESINGDHLYISEILLASGFLKDPDSVFRIAQLHSTGSLIKPELFDILEKTNDECHKESPNSRSNDKIRRRMIFDSVNDILFHKVANSGFSGERCRRLMSGDKLLKELWSEIDNLQSSSERCIYDEDDEVKNLVSADVNKGLEGWDRCCYEVSGLVLDIERLIFKDLIDEVVNADATRVQDHSRRRCRRLFSM